CGRKGLRTGAVPPAATAHHWQHSPPGRYPLSPPTFSYGLMSAQPAALPDSASVIDAIVESLVSSVSAPRQREYGNLARQFFARVPTDELTSRDARTWAAICAGMIEFLRERPRNTP